MPAVETAQNPKAMAVRHQSEGGAVFPLTFLKLLATDVPVSPHFSESRN